jgi:putative endonuclease
MTYAVYILTNAHHTVFYTGVTNDLTRRVYEHKHKLIDGFTKQYNVDKLVYFEVTDDINAAIHREKIIKKWKRSFKFDAIERMNPEWKDLHFTLLVPVEEDPATSAG